MYCLKCGNETQDEKVFCEACLQSMEQYPVKPGTAIFLPKQDSASTQKKPATQKRSVSAEDQAILLKKILRWTLLLLLIAVGALGFTVAKLLHII